ncbi:hypothetical protein [Neptuniibacter sp.]|uniref:hypothetical protein n=1 Tax=Neptuniibacter sp. TaxID=1962643 RepID=UPI003B5C4B0C
MTDKKPTRQCGSHPFSSTAAPNKPSVEEIKADRKKRGRPPLKAVKPRPKPKPKTRPKSRRRRKTKSEPRPPEPVVINYPVEEMDTVQLKRTAREIWLKELRSRAYPRKHKLPPGEAEVLTKLLNNGGLAIMQDGESPEDVEHFRKLLIEHGVKVTQTTQSEL